MMISTYKDKWVCGRIASLRGTRHFAVSHILPQCLCAVRLALHSTPQLIPNGLNHIVGEI